jgi:hypothetical protein
MTPSPFPQLQTKDTAALNAAFQALSPGDRRRAIAFDILARIESAQLIAETGEWLTVEIPYMRRGEGRDLQALMHGDTQCRVCAIGAAICSIAAFEDAINVYGNDDYGRPGVSPNKDSIAKRLSELFGMDQALLIERAFEGAGAALRHNVGAYPAPEPLSQDLIDAADAFHDRYDQTDRLRAIWTLIAEHPEGRFELPVATQPSTPATI